MSRNSSIQHSEVNRSAGLDSTPMGSPDSRQIVSPALRKATTNSPSWEGIRLFFMVRWMDSTSSTGSVSMGTGWGRSLQNTWSWALAAASTQPECSQKS